MKTLISYIGIIAVVHAAVIPHNFQVNEPVERTSILGPSGSITKQRNLITTKNGALSSQSTIQEEITNILGPSGSIKEQKYLGSLGQPLEGNSHVQVKYSSPVVVQKVAHKIENLPSEKTSIVGPSGSIVQEKSRNSGIQVAVSGIKHVETTATHSSAHDEDCVHSEAENTAKLNQKFYLQLKSPVLVQYKFPSSQKTEVPQGSNLLSKVKTNIVGPSGSISQELSTGNNNFIPKVHNVVKDLPAPVKPVIVKYGFSSVPQVAVPYSTNVAEKTSIVGPSGSITQEIHSNKNAPFVAVKPVEVQYAKVPISHGTYVVSQPSEKSVIIGPSGSITKEVTPNVNEHSAAVHRVVEVAPVVKSGVSTKTDIVGPSGHITQEISSNSNGYIASAPQVVRIDTISKPVSSSHVFVASEKHIPAVVKTEVKPYPPASNVALSYSTNSVNGPIEKTSIVGASGSITQEKYLQSTKDNTVKVTPVIAQVNTPVYVQYAQYPGKHIIVDKSYTQNIPVEKTNIVGPSGSITHEISSSPTVSSSHVFVSSEKHIPAVVKTEVKPYPPASDVALSYSTNSVNGPIEKTTIIGASGSITQEKYSQSTKDNTVKVTPVIAQVNTPVYVQYAQYPGKHIIVDKSYIQNIPVEKTNIVGPSGSITHEISSSPTVNKFQTAVTQINNEAEDDCDESHDTRVVSVTPEKTNIATAVNVPFTSPIVVQYDVPQYVQHVEYVKEQNNHNVPIEKTRILGSSGSITREQYLQSTVQSPLKVQVTPAAVSYVSPVVKYSPENAPIEKISILGPSGSITREQYLQSTHSVVQSPLKVQVTPAAVSYVSPVVGYSSDNTPIEKTSILGPSGSITREQYSQSSKAYVQSPVKVQYTPTLVSYVSPVVGYSSDSAPIEKTSILGPSGSIVQEKNVQAGYKSIGDIYFYSTQPVSVVSPFYGNEKTSVFGPSGSITQERNSGSFAYHENGDVSPIENVFIPYESYGFVKHSDPVVKVTSADSNVNSYGPYPPSPKYPNIAAPDC